MLLMYANYRQKSSDEKLLKHFSDKSTKIYQSLAQKSTYCCQLTRQNKCRDMSKKKIHFFSQYNTTEHIEILIYRVITSSGKLCKAVIITNSAGTLMTGTIIIIITTTVM